MGYHFSDEECFSRKLHSKIGTILTELYSTHKHCVAIIMYTIILVRCAAFTLFCV